MATPQVIVTLSPQGNLVAELPGLNGSRRKIELSSPARSDYTQALANSIQTLEAIRDLSELNQAASDRRAKAHETSKPEDILLAHQAEEIARSASLKAQNLNSCIAALSSLIDKNETACGVLYRILDAQVQNQTKLGEDGAPTAAQVKHWERHELFSDPLCPFCKAEGRFPTGKNRERAIRGMKPADAIRLGLEFRGYKPSNSAKSPGLWIKPNSPHIYFRLTPHGRAKVLDAGKVEFSQSAREALILDGKEQARRIGWEPPPETKKQNTILLKRDGFEVRVVPAKGKRQASSSSSPKQKLSELEAELEY